MGNEYSTKGRIKEYITKKIFSLQNSVNDGYVKATLANLRRGIGSEPGEDLNLLGFILLDMPESFMSKSGVPTKEEWTCYITLTLYALHQQGYDIHNKSMHTNGERSLGGAMKALFSTYSKSDKNAEQRTLKKLQMLVSSVNMREFSVHLRSIVNLIKREAIPLNYAQLAGDIYDFQFEESKNRVSLRWGQDFYKNKKDDEKEIK